MSQIVLETTTKQSPDQVIENAKTWFIEEFGLDVVEEAECCLRLEGVEGFVYIRADDDGNKTTVNLEGQGYTPQLRRFMEQVAS